MRHLKHARSQLFSWENGSREHIMVSEALGCALQVLQKVTVSPTQKNANRFFKNSEKIMLTNFSLFSKKQKVYGLHGLMSRFQQLSERLFIFGHF